MTTLLACHLASFSAETVLPVENYRVYGVYGSHLVLISLEHKSIYIHTHTCRHAYIHIPNRAYTDVYATCSGVSVNTNRVLSKGLGLYRGSTISC
ncbi:hypothetical protein EON63_00900 [archaeon]|nr:MAG: hypothetical protein EON63_00900 [archaeon]